DSTYDCKTQQNATLTGQEEEGDVQLKYFGRLMKKHSLSSSNADRYMELQPVFYPSCTTRGPYCGLPSLGSTDGSKPLLFTPLYSSPLAYHGGGSIHLSAVRGPESSPLYGMAPKVETSASNLTKGSPVQIPPAPALTNAKTLDTLQPTQERTTLTPRDLDPSQRLASQAIPPEAAHEYISNLSPTTPINIPQLALYSHDHPDRASVDAVLTQLTGLTEDW
ncbi:unnamed protein product, partial [Porites lobata]